MKGLFVKMEKVKSKKLLVLPSVSKEAAKNSVCRQNTTTFDVHMSTFMDNCSICGGLLSLNDTQ